MTKKAMIKMILEALHNSNATYYNKEWLEEHEKFLMRESKYSTEVEFRNLKLNEK